MTTQALNPAAVNEQLRNGAMLVDIRDTGDHAREKIAGAVNIPLDRVESLKTEATTVIFHCKSGMRTSSNSNRLQLAAANAEVFLLAGGIDAWREAGLATQLDRSQPIEIMRQVQIAAGLLILLGIALGFWLHPGFIGISAFVGAGLLFAGSTGWCGMAKLLGIMPWNRTTLV